MACASNQRRKKTITWLLCKLHDPPNDVATQHISLQLEAAEEKSGNSGHFR